MGQQVTELSQGVPRVEFNQARSLDLKMAKRAYVIIISNGLVFTLTMVRQFIGRSCRE